ncbi:MAG TPA: energy transducer TonB [Opitutus sp.]|nr:energy transducer TonB [Opitutus sp.]
METRFILPVTVAAALHALVLFGVGESAAPARLPRPADPPAPPFVVRFNDPDVQRDTQDPQPEAKPLKGSPEVRRPEMDEPPTKLVSDGRLTEPVRPVVKVDFHPDRVLPGVAGVIDGDDSGSLTGVVVLDSRLLDNAPQTRSQVSPFYPAELKNLGVTGEVMVEFIVDETGRVLEPRVVRSTNRGFDGATLRAVARWRFEPGKKDGRTVRFRMAVPVEFSLGG